MPLIVTNYQVPRTHTKKGAARGTSDLMTQQLMDSVASLVEYRGLHDSRQGCQRVESALAALSAPSAHSARAVPSAISPGAAGAHLPTVEVLAEAVGLREVRMGATDGVSTAGRGAAAQRVLSRG